MRLRLVAAAALAASLALAATASATIAPGASPNASTATTLTIWLQEDAKSSWEAVVTSANAAFKAKHADVEVNVEYQKWTDHLTKLDAAIAGNNAPDVVEMGNSEMINYMAAGAFADLTAVKRTFPNSSTWLSGLTDSATYNGKLYGVPYYAGARAVVYRKDFYRKAKITKLPTSLAEFYTAGQKLMAAYKSDRRFSAFYVPGQNWHFGLAYVYDYGGAIARFRNGQWQGTLTSPQAIRGLTQLKQHVVGLSRASKTTDEANPQQSLVFAQNHVAAFPGLGWEVGYAQNEDTGNPKLKATMAAYPMPSHTRGKTMPQFIGGSDLAVPAAGKNRALALEWLREFTSTRSMRMLVTVGKQVPNTTSLAGAVASNPALAPFAKAASRGWFIPTSTNWAKVEKARVLENMLQSIMTGRSTVPAAAKRASDQVTQILNS
jgi:N,N'-diacetylchitobiose transport system substrate-binding protein